MLRYEVFITMKHCCCCNNEKHITHWSYTYMLELCKLYLAKINTAAFFCVKALLNLIYQQQLIPKTAKIKQWYYSTNHHIA